MKISLLSRYATLTLCLALTLFGLLFWPASLWARG
ncbi:Ferredoxin-dependent glutamate synthase [Pseudomonas chlororaphis subsp. aurantiaca]|nr:Ferredoxin-dependent glutamate synthase [Pseudomonas chlororaphis subsp. aurantiaca]